MNTATNSTYSTCTPYAFGATDRRFHWAVREDEGFYVPELLTDPEYDADPEVHAAFEEQAVHLREAEGLVGDARNLVELMLAANEYETDSRAMQADAALRVIEEKLKEAFERVDRGRARYLNLFLAYFELKK